MVSFRWGKFFFQRTMSCVGAFFGQDRGKYVYANGDEFMGLWDKGVKLSGTFYYKEHALPLQKQALSLFLHVSAA